MNRRFARAAVVLCATLVSACYRQAPPPPPKADTGAATDPALTGALADQIMVDPTLSQQANGKSARAADAPAQAPVPPPAVLAQNAPTPSGAAHAPDARPAPAADCAGKDCRPATVTLAELAAAQRARQAKAAPAPSPATASAPAAPRANEPASPATAATPKQCDDTLAYSAGWAAKLPADLPVYPGGQVSEAAGNDAPGCSIRVVSFTTAASWRTVLDWYYSRVTKAGWSADHTIRHGDHVLGGTRAKGGAYYLIFTDQGAKGTAIDMVVSADR